MYDLIITGGRLIEPSQSLDGPYDVAVKDGKVAAIAPSIDAQNASKVIDAKGKIVTPGLVDLHTHCYWGSTLWGIDVDQVAPVSGTTTFIDAGTAGAYTFPGFRKFIIERARPRVLAFLNISSIGLAHFTFEVSNLNYVDTEMAVRAAQNNIEHIVGIKVRLDALTVGENDVIPLNRAVEAAEALKLPVMVHIGRKPPALKDIVKLMRPGDVLTHCFTGGDNRNRLVDDTGKAFDFIRQAISEGIVLDIGHGSGSFSYDSAEKLLDQGISPDVISTDVHQLSVAGPMFDLPTTMSKFLNLGLSLPEVVRKTTVAPAKVVRRELGTLKVGQPADVALLELQEGDFTFTDATGQQRRGRLKLKSLLTIVGGQVLTPPSPAEVEDQERRVMAGFIRERFRSGGLARLVSPAGTANR